MNYIAIDPSLSCTAMVVNDKKFVYTTPTVAHTKKGELKRWFQECEDQGVSIRIFHEVSDGLSHSDTELEKLDIYRSIVAHIIQDIVFSIGNKDDIIVGIEGYSHSSSVGPLIDLVTFSTLLRSKLTVDFGLEFFKKMGILDKQPIVKIYQPTEVKRFAAMLSYAPIQKGKKTEYRNTKGVAGGSFKKPEIYQALLDNPSLTTDNWVTFLREHSEEILDMKSIPKPIEDINDAKTLYEIIKAPQPFNK